LGRIPIFITFDPYCHENNWNHTDCCWVGIDHPDNGATADRGRDHCVGHLAEPWSSGALITAQVLPTPDLRADFWPFVGQITCFLRHNAPKTALRYSLMFFVPLCLMTIFGASAQPLQTVPSVDLAKYMGTWYEIASFPQRFQKGCCCTTAEYALSEKGHVVVMNRCRKGGPDGKKTMVKGKAFVVEGTNNAKLKVQFFWPFKGDYWIIDLATDYSYAVVSHPKRNYLWILSRSPQLDPATYAAILLRLKNQQLDTGKLVMTPQN
jgi:apolipoprotein D and lipocalin family protein